MSTLTAKKTTNKAKEIPQKAKVYYTTKARKFVQQTWKHQLFVMIYRSRHKSSKVFASLLFTLILLSTIVTMLETVQEINQAYSSLLKGLSWFFTIVFTIEYFLRIIALPRPGRYVFSPMGILDFVAIFPSYLLLWSGLGVNYLMVVRFIRIFRIFRVFDLVKHSGEANVLLIALKASRHKITIFILSVLSCVIIVGSLMFIIEGPKNGFHNIPTAVYWAIVTLTTVGYGDLAPQTPLGQVLASLMMLMGYSTIVVPTSIVSAEIAKHRKTEVLEGKTCLGCGIQGHDSDAKYCKHCGSNLWQN